MTQAFGMWKAIRWGGTLAIVIALVGCVQRTGTQPQTRTKAVLDEAARLDAAVNALYDRSKFQEAIPLAERSLALREKSLTVSPLEVAISLNNLARLYQAQGVYARVEPLYARALDIRERALGAMHTGVAEILNNLANLYQDQGAYTRSEPLYVRALDINERALGAMHPEIAVNLNNLASLYLDQGAFARAEPLYIRALNIREKVLGAMHPDVAQSLNNLALIYQEQGAYTRAESLYVRALDIREKALGAIHPAVANTLNNLATLYKEEGAYARAEPLYVRALGINEKTLGAMHPGISPSLNNLAMLYYSQGVYGRAEPLFIRALDIDEKAWGPMHPAVAVSLDNLASLYQAQGSYTRAEALCVRALDIREKVLGEMHPDVARSLNNLAGLYQAQGAYTRAEPLLVRALDIREKALGTMHPAVAVTISNLASLYRDQGAYARAEPLAIRALEIDEKALGAMHPAVALSLNNLAGLYHDQGVYARAEPLYARSLDINEKALGSMHPEVARSLNNLANLYQAQGAYVRAEPLFARAAELREAHLRTELAHLSESRKRDLISPLQGETERLVSSHAHAMPTSTQALELAFTAVLRRKGRVLDSLTDTQATLREHLTPQLRDKLAQLADVSTQLSMRLRAPFNPRSAENQKSEISALRVRIDGLEGELNQASVEFRVQVEPVTIGRIQAAIPRGSALVELVRYRRFDARQAKGQARWKEAHYLAYLLFEHGTPQWVDLGDAARIDAGVDAVVAAMRKGTSANAAKLALRHLDALVFAPVRERLGGVSHVIVSPDGKLNLVPFEALIDPRGHYVLEQRLISYVTSGRDLLRLAARRASRPSATIVADPDYGPPGKPYARVDGTVAETYARLAGTRVEAQEIEEYFSDRKTLIAGQATKAALMAVVGPSVLHIATHGFYMRAAAVPAAPPRSRPASSERGMSIDGALPPLPPSAEDPTDALDHAGLALAGANVGPDGIVTARELAGRDWWGTQLVVLSACGTGVGAMPSGEGVYGLRRALVLAGAQSQVVSLWNVNDSSTPELMREFYAELARGTGRAEALRRAKLRMLQQPRFAHPYYWAAFIPAGDWKPLAPGTMHPVGAAARSSSSTRQLVPVLVGQ
jgi:CHAT domain-containing protein/tetratricopeptide (TPR) repeat protein